MTQILIFGDSITWGACDLRGGWAQRLKEFLDDRGLKQPEIYFETYNLGVSGDTTEDLLRRFEFELKQRRIDEGENRIIIFAIGTNDSLWIKNPNNRLLLPEKFQKNLNTLVKSAQKYSKDIVLVGLFPVDENLTQPFGISKTGKSYDNDSIEKYEKIIEAVSKQNKAGFVPMFSNFSKTNYKTLLEDGLHPNSEWHEKMFELVKDHLIKNKLI